MHLIPQSWSHLHILVSVFPSCGLMFVLGFYIAGFVANNDAMKRTSLALFGVLAVLAIPTYLSGAQSMTALADASSVNKDSMNTHYYLGLVALLGLVIAGAAAWYELWRTWGQKQLSSLTMNVVLGLAILTLALMVITDEYGWEVNHYELHLPPKEGPYMAPGTTPETWSHVHMVLNHFPTVG